MDTGVKTESGMTSFLYNTVFGRLLLKLLTRPIISKIAGAFLSTALSRPMIAPFIRNNKIDMTDYENEAYKSFNDFFSRRIKQGARARDMEKSHMISPCDGRLSVFPIDEHSEFWIKGSPYTIADLLENSPLAEKYSGGLCMIFRLCVDDYHRYCYFDSGTKTENHKIAGVLHTVRPIALERYNIYKRNAREYTLLETENFGTVVQIEVGAMMVGKICNFHGTHSFNRGEEKGMFRFGGSTIVLLMPKNAVTVGSDITEASARGCEIKVKQGEWIGDGTTKSDHF